MENEVKKMKMKVFGFVVFLVFVFVVSGCIGSGGNGSKIFEEIIIYIGGISGVYFLFGLKYVEIFNKNGIKVKVVMSGVSVINVKVIGEGKV